MNSEQKDEAASLALDEVDLLEERALAIDRTSKRLDRFLNEMKELEEEIDRLELMLYLPGLSVTIRQNISMEIDLSTDAFNHLHDAATDAYRQLICQRECFGFRGHELIQRCFPIPDLRLPRPMPVEVLEV
jgi:hypothetical protein